MQEGRFLSSFRIQRGRSKKLKAFDIEAQGRELSSAPWVGSSIKVCVLKGHDHFEARVREPIARLRHGASGAL
jgi:hypothetical protein